MNNVSNFQGNALGALSILAKMETPVLDKYKVPYSSIKAALECNKVAWTDVNGNVLEQDTIAIRKHLTSVTFQNSDDGSHTNLMALVKQFVEDNGYANDYDYNKDDFLRYVVDHKFNPQLNPKAYNCLMATTQDELVFQNSWGDKFWGKCLDETTGEWVGLNYLGQLYTACREQHKRRLNGCTITPEQVRQWVMDKREGREITDMPEDYPIVWALSADGARLINYDTVEDGMNDLYSLVADQSRVPSKKAEAPVIQTSEASKPEVKQEQVVDTHAQILASIAQLSTLVKNVVADVNELKANK